MAGRKRQADVEVEETGAGGAKKRKVEEISFLDDDD